MKSNKKNLIVLILLVMGFVFLPNIDFDSSVEQTTFDNGGLKISGTYTNITINDFPGSSNNWAWAKTQPWCSGSGTELDPYIIEAHKILMYLPGHGIRIVNSSSYYFTIKNCNITWDTTQTNTLLMTGIFLSNTTKGQIVNNTIYHLGKGIHLNNVANVQIVNNTIYDHPREGIFAENCDSINIIENDIFDNSYDGIYFLNVNNSQLIDNTCSNNDYGIYLDVDCNNSIISGNTANDNDNHGIYTTSHNNTISGNTANDNGHSGLYVEDYIDNNTISGNILNDNIIGINLGYSDNNNISENTANNNIDYGIFLTTDCDNNMISENTANNNSDSGIYLEDYCENNIVTGNIAHNNSLGIYLYFCDNNTVSGNTANDNTDGIYLEESNDNVISGNTVKENSQNGIYSYFCDYNNITGNTANNNNWNGIELELSINNTISGNTVNNNAQHGIYLSVCHYNLIARNNINDNFGNGIQLFGDEGGCHDNNITDNILYNNNAGIYFDDNCYDNNITKNILYNNTLGIIFDHIFCDSNSLYENFFLGNGKHAEDWGTNNNWNSTTIGNYWDNHTSPDTTPQDGIVDIQYNISGSAGSIDYLPIAEDGAPSITINSPNDAEVFGSNTPSYDVTITDTFLLEMWYTLDGGLHNYTFTEFTGTIDQSAWDALSDGTITLSFYASDIPGNIGSADVTIVKDATAPILVIISPIDDEEFGTHAPLFNITITDDHLDSIWYSLDGGVTTHDITTNATIDQITWTALSDGPITITFYANDTLGNEASKEVIITKTIPPAGDDPTIVIVIVVVSIVGGVVVLTVVYIFMKKRA